MNPVSMFASAHATAPKDCDAAAVVNAIRTGKWRNAVESVRSAYATTYAEARARGDDHAAATKAAKRAVGEQKKALPAVAFSGTFSTRANAALLAHSGLLCADLDDLDAEALARCRATLAASPFVWALFTSPTASGLKAVFKVPADGVRHADSFAAVQSYVRQTCGLEIDQACKDVSRLCFVSYDPAATLNEAAAELPVAEAEPAEAKPPPKRPAAEPSKPATPPDLERRLAIARELFGSIDSHTKPPRLFVKCPGISSHTNGDAPTDCELHLDGAPNVTCVHNSCRAAVEAASRELQSRIGKAEYGDLAKRLDDLAKLPPLLYERQREAAARELGVRVSALDAEVFKRRPAAEPTGPAEPKPAEPWGEAVDGAELLDDLRRTFKRFLVLPAGAAELLPLWVLHSYAFEAFVFTPYLSVGSATKRSGKTTLMELLAELVARPLMASGISPASVFRIVEARKPSLLIDEFDALPDETREALRGVLNSGFKRGGSFVRCVGDDHEVTQFSTFCPKALSGIGEIADTVADRSIRVTMSRKTQGEKVERFRRFDGSELRRRCLRWATDSRAALATAAPAIPEQLNDRQQDICEPLLAVADLAGSEWPRLARESLLTMLDSGPDDDQQPLNVLLLSDLRRLLLATDDGKIFSKDLRTALMEIDDRPWAGMNKGAGISTHQIARMLRQFGIGSRSVWSHGESAKGYDLDDCRDAFDRYLSAENPPSKRQNVKPPVNIERNEVFGNVSAKVPDVSENAIPTNKDAGSDVLTFPNAEKQEELL